MGRLVKSKVYLILTKYGDGKLRAMLRNIVEKGVFFFGHPVEIH